MLDDWARERFIRKVLKRLAGQRVGLILQPGNIWVVEKAVTDDDKVAEALRTCHMRGWVEPITNSIPQGELTPDGQLPNGELFSGRGPVYRLTEAGWNVIHRTHEWVVLTFVVASIALFATIVGIWVNQK